MKTKKHLTYEDRKQLENMYSAGTTLSEAAVSLGVHVTTIYREIIRGSTDQMDKNGRIGYSAEIAQKASLKRLNRNV